jgi:hypothetical protein
MDISELQAIELEENVAFSFNRKAGTIAVKGKSAAVDRALERVEGHRDEVVKLLRERQGEPEDEVVERQVAFNVPSLAVQRQNYIRWFSAKSSFYHPSETELDAMFAACEEGWEIIFDFAQSFTARLPNGLLISIDRKGRRGEVSPYSPAVLQQKQRKIERDEDA